MLREFNTNKDGSLLKEGDIIKMPLLAKTLERIAENGGSDFYSGGLANDIIADLNDASMCK